MKKYWFTLLPETFLWIKNNHGLVYQSANQKSFKFNLVGEIANICNHLLVTENLYTVELTEIDIEEIGSWINSVMEINAGYLTQKDVNVKKPVAFKPIVKIQDNTKHYIWQHKRGIGGEIIQNLHELTFYINGSRSGDDSKYRQTVFPIKECDELNINEIIGFINNAKSYYLFNVNVVGNIFTYSEFDTLFAYMSESQKQFTINITIVDFANNMQRIISTEWTDNICFNILIDGSREFPVISLENININVSVTVLIFTETGYTDIVNCFETVPVYCDAKVIPLSDGMNIEFFENNIFTCEEDLKETVLTKREIFMRQELNINDFGKLTIMPDGRVYANVNMSPLGTIDDTIYSLVYKEFTEGKSWLRIRDQFPCTECIYQWLCPSPSNYETVIGRPNLCTIVNQ